MKTVLLFFALLNSIYAFQFDEYFIEKTMRVDFYHSGNATTEELVFHKIIEEKYWGGSKKNLIDTIGYGNFFFKVYDKESNKLIYSRGYSSLFQEWQFTEEAKANKRIFQETIVFPYPKNPVRLEIFKRDRRNNFEILFTKEIDPKNFYIAKDSKFNFITEKLRGESPSDKALDIALIPEGYTQSELNDFKNKANELADYLLTIQPFSNYKNKINFWIVNSPSVDSGCDIPGENIWKNTLMNSTFYTFESERYLMTTEMWTVRDIAANVPYDQIFILTNTDKYGGGGIYNYYSITSANNKLSDKVFVHEFGHGFVGLADEYGDDPTYINYYPSDVEPWEPNITTLANFKNKWESLVDKEIPIPTPNDKKYFQSIGVFEGAGYASKNVFRSTYDSIMRTLKTNKFNLVSTIAIEKMLKFYTD
ncbi:MAG: IgA Peptidase M64 [Ignavibacteriales bacterium]